MWFRIGSRCGPGKDRSIPKSIPNDWEDDRGQFIKSDNSQIIWRRGRWEKRFDKFLKKEEIDFYYYGHGYADFNCTNLVINEQDCNGIE